MQLLLLFLTIILSWKLRAAIRNEALTEKIRFLSQEDWYGISKLPKDKLGGELEPQIYFINLGNKRVKY